MTSYNIVLIRPTCQQPNEALRAALGLTLRGDAVRVFVDSSIHLGEEATRMTSVLQELGHHVSCLTNLQRSDLAGARTVEIWS